MTADRGSVSVVVPVLDDATALARCLDRLGRQTRRPDEVVVVDNGSTDTSVAVARAYGARVVTEPRRGIPHAAATGYDAAAGDVIVRCDADSLPGPRWLERLVAPLEHDSGLDAVTGLGVFRDAPRGSRTLLTVLYLGAYYVTSHLALGHTALWGSNMALRRTSWAEVSTAVHREADVHDDMDLAFVLGPRRRIRLVPVVVGVSARSLRGGVQMRRRFGRARRTLELNWRTSPPWLRWRDRHQETWGQISSWVSRKPVR
ncbi:glycosyltransferase family 2 protein [Aeromicrobium sp. IC_218]|uniref:glycosyltransferase family 2 protein n=1 Tax=Aeromicrobium sp. IC_218 TaxID=2545468 RepID=UPI00103DC82F|nr:glycosyltransferase family 2 protein [Aeromicrobium sp. IC_218]TCJ00133.1 glycosyltransferase [Aeromicrobium sp. IC_218]